MAGNIIDKTPPHDEELERAALGSLLEDWDAVAVANQQHLRPEDFYNRANSRILEAILSLDTKGLRPDIKTVVQELKQLGKIDEAGGAAYVSNLTTIIPSSANIEYYVQSVKNYSLKRSLLKLASEISVNARDETKEADELLDYVQKNIFDLSDDRYAFTSRKIGDVLREAIQLIDDVLKSKNPITGIPSGFEDIDSMTCGFHSDEFIILGARPSIGKTTFALNLASHISFHHKIPAAFFSLEMRDVTLVQRLISSEAMVGAQKLRSGFLSTSEYARIVDVMSVIYDASFYIVDIPNMKMPDLRSQARKLRAQQQVEIIFVDYLGLIAHDIRTMPRYEQISDISRSLKALARELHIPIVVLCQLNRDAQYETPTLANLRDSGSIEQDADLVMFLHREVPKKKKSEDDSDPAEIGLIPTDLIIAKQRNGPTGTVHLTLESKFAKFSPVAKK
jgi:replicative DNA helicase